MIAPLYKLGAFGDPWMIVIAILVGFVFGFMLESAGFGNSTIIAKVFYMEDLRVFKMMLSIVVTAMTLTFLSYYLGFLDIWLVQLATVNLLPIIVGGVVFGAGMVIGGYCPGTGSVALATKKVDGIIFLVGFVVGIIVYAEFYSLVKDFATGTNFGKITLADITAIPFGVWAFLVLFLAIPALYGLDQIRGKLYKKD